MGRRITSQFDRMFRRGAFLQWYINEGMDAMEFSNAFTNVEDVIADYNQYQNASGYQVVLDHENHPYKLSPPVPIEDYKEKEGNEENVENRAEEESNPERSNAQKGNIDYAHSAEDIIENVGGRVHISPERSDAEERHAADQEKLMSNIEN